MLAEVCFCAKRIQPAVLPRYSQAAVARGSRVSEIGTGVVCSTFASPASHRGCGTAATECAQKDKIVYMTCVGWEGVGT